MSIPKFNEFMKPVLSKLKDKNELRRKELYKSLSEYFNLSKEDMLEMNPSGHMLIYKSRISWALTYLKKAGLIESPQRSCFIITNLGISVLKEDPQIINSKYLKKFDSFCEFNKVNKNKTATIITNEDISEEETPQEVLVISYNTISEALSDDVLSEVMKQTPAFFEKLVVDLLVKMGYGGNRIENSQVIGKSGDEGIDGIIKEDKLGFDKIYIQAKQWDIKRTVGRPEIQKFVGALTGQGATKGAFITTASFTKEAVSYVDKQHTCKIVLIDGKKLTELMIEHDLGVSIEETYYIKKIDTDYFNDDSY
jgi:restriction system protein